MNGEWMATVAVVVASGALGTAVRLWLGASMGTEVVALAAVNLAGWFMVGVISGRYGSRMRQLRFAMVVLGLTAFTSLMSLVVDGVSVAGDVVIAVLEVAFGVMFAGVGHLVTMRRGVDP